MKRYVNGHLVDRGAACAIPHNGDIPGTSKRVASTGPITGTTAPPPKPSRVTFPCVVAGCSNRSLTSGARCRGCLSEEEVLHAVATLQRRLAAIRRGTAATAALRTPAAPALIRLAREIDRHLATIGTHA